MAWRFRRSVRLLPGVRLNFSGSGVTTTLGPRGAHVTLGGKRTRVSTGIPGTGASYSTLLPSRSKQGQRSGSGGLWIIALIVVVAVARCGNSDHRTMTTSSAPVVPAQAAVQAPPSETFSDFSVTAAALNVRDAPDGRLVGRATRGNTLHVYETTDEWARVSARDEAPRWVSRKGICAGAGCAARFSASSTQPTSPSTSVVPVARTLISAAPPRRAASADYGCACSSGRTCVGPRGGVYCFTSGGNKRYVGRR